MNIKTDKGKYYTTSETYTDMDGQYRNFTMIDCDKKTKIALPSLGEDFTLYEEPDTTSLRLLVEEVLHLSYNLNDDFKKDFDDILFKLGEGAFRLNKHKDLTFTDLFRPQDEGWEEALLNLKLKYDK